MLNHRHEELFVAKQKHVRAVSFLAMPSNCGSDPVHHELGQTGKELRMAYDRQAWDEYASPPGNRTFSDEWSAAVGRKELGELEGKYRWT